jgi:hypothetical protein
MDGFQLLRDFWDYSFENPSKISTSHIALYCYIINHSNRLGWKEEFGLPTYMTMEAVSIKSIKTYSKALNDLIDLGFIKLVKKSQNQFSSNIIALVKFTEPTTKALDKAMLNQLPKQVETNDQGKYTIDNIIPNTENIIPKTEIKNKNEIFVSELLESHSWLETICMQNHLTPPKVKDWLKAFDLKLKAEMDIKSSKKDFCSHFSRWLPGELIKLSNKVVIENKPAYMRKALT